jgi:hypothetical protein
MTLPTISRYEVVSCVALLCLAIGLLLTMPGRSEAGGAGSVRATEAPAVEVCFPAADWSAREEDRPCDLLKRPQEDGSGRLTLGTLGADAAVCIIPNPWEERGRFAIRCRRLPNR